MLMQVSGTRSLRLGATTIALPQEQGSYLMVVKTDSAYKNLTYKILNSGGILIGRIDDINSIPICLSKKDSLYVILTSELPNTSAIDGISVNTELRSALVVFDPKLVVKRTVNLGSTTADGNYNAGYRYSTRRRLFLKVFLRSETCWCLPVFTPVRMNHRHRVYRKSTATYRCSTP